MNWEEIATVFLDMDGTLLDLRFDNHFWQEFVPLKFAEKEGLSITAAKERLVPKFRSKEGSLDWYCLDFWSRELKLDIVGLKQELVDLINVLPHASDFLEKLSASSQQVVLVTNAHRGSLDLKMEKTGLLAYFNAVVSSHDFKLPKEHPDFWAKLQQHQRFDKQTTVLIDDSLAVLRSARDFGIAHLVSISRPDTSQPKREIDEFKSIEDFRALTPGL